MIPEQKIKYNGKTYKHIAHFASLLIYANGDDRLLVNEDGSIKFGYALSKGSKFLSKRI